MKKIFLLPTLAFAVSTLSSFNNDSSNLSLNNISNVMHQQQQTVDAFIMIGGNWMRGQITYMRTQRGFQPIRFYFNEQLKGEFWPDQTFIPLNPNNQLAKQNNWTHTISVQAISQGGTAYLTLY